MENPHGSNTTVHPNGKITARFEFITPELAADWLETLNKMNRGKRKNQIATLSDDMEEHNYLENGEPYIFDSDGYIVNGQHRLQAQVNTNRALWVLVVRGVDPQARTTVDSNVRRTFADDLQMTGHTNSVLRENLVRNMMRWDRNGGLASTQFKPSRRALASRYGLYEKELDAAILDAMRWGEAWGGNRIAMIFTYWLLAERLQFDKAIVRRFFSILSIGSQSPNDEVLLRLKRKISEPRSISANGQISHMPTWEEVWWLIAGWNKWISGDQSKYISPRNGISDPYPAPVAVGGAE